MTPNKKIKLADIECIDNRKIEGIEELAANIAAVGLLQPVILTKADGGKYRVVDGRRRFRALGQLGREHLEPEEYVLFTGEDELTSVAAFSANFSRQNLTLAEEVEQLSHLAGSQQEIAALLGKSASWVALRQNLANLSGKWVEVLNHPEQYPQWTAAKLELIAREPEEVQKSLEYLVDDGEIVTLRELREMLDGDHRLLKTANFNTECCKECPKRTGAQGLLFAELDDGLDCCLDFECYRKKSLDAIKALLKAQPHFIPIMGDRGDYGSDEYRYACDIDAKHSYDFKVLREPGIGDKPNAVVVFGNDIGKLMFAVPRKDAAISPARKTVTDDGGKVVTTEKTVAEREAELKAKRVKLALSDLLWWLESDGNTLDKWIARGHYDDRKTHAACVKLAVWFGCDGEVDGEFAWKNPALTGIGDREFAKKVFEHAKYHFELAVREEINRTLANINVHCGEEICKLLFLDWDDQFFKPAIAQLPEPKSLVAARIKEKQQANKKAKGK